MVLEQQWPYLLISPLSSWTKHLIEFPAVKWINFEILKNLDLLLCKMVYKTQIKVNPQDFQLTTRRNEVFGSPRLDRGSRRALLDVVSPFFRYQSWSRREHRYFLHINFRCFCKFRATTVMICSLYTMQSLFRNICNCKDSYRAKQQLVPVNEKEERR